MRRDDVPLLAVFILDERDKSGTVRVVLQGEHGCGHIRLLAFKVDNTVFFAVRAAAMADGDPAVAVAAGFIAERGQKALLRRYLGKPGIIRDGHAAPAGGSRFIIDHRHSDSHSS